MSTILVVEDEAIIARDIQMTLESLGYGVLAPVASGAEALAAAKEHQPDLVLMDIRIDGEMDGIETATLIRDRHATPVVYLTSHSDDATLARATRMGAYGFILKPFSDRDLRTAVEVALQKRIIEERLSAQERWFAATLRSVGDAVIATDPVQRITFMNAVAERITGWRASDAVGKDITAVFRLVDEPTGTPLESPLTRVLREGFAVQLPREVIPSTKAGVHRAVDDSAAPILDDRGNTVGGVVVFRDVTERRQLEDRLAHVERLAAIGTLSAGMAHEINNPLLGGDVTVQSRPGRGATFRVALPPARVRLDADAATSPTAHAAPVLRARVLVLDGEPAIGRAVARMLSPQHEVRVCEDPREALARVAAGEHFDILLCDLMMPVMDGMAFLAALSAGTPEQARRVVFITGGATSEAARSFLEGTSHVVLTKPFDPAALRRVVLDYASAVAAGGASP